jgi:hypothetical protein
MAGIKKLRRESMNKSAKRLVLVALMIMVVSFAYGETPAGKSWGITAQVSNASRWIGGVFHLGSGFMIRPGAWSLGSPSGSWTSFGLRSDFLFTGNTKNDLMWYVGPGILGEVFIDIGSGSIDIDIEIAVKLGAQAMIAPNVALYTDIGLLVMGNMLFGAVSQGTFEGIYAKSYGLGAVIYIK